MSEQDTWNRITAYLAENKIKKALEAKLQQKMVIGTIKKDVIQTIGDERKEKMGANQKLDCIFDISAQIVSGYVVSKQRLQESIDIEGKVVATKCLSTKWLMTKIVGAEGE